MALACRLAPAAAAAAAARRRLPVLCRAASARAAATAATEAPAAAAAAPPYSFQQAAAEPAAFPELLEPGRRAVLLAVDPDLNGAVVALSWRNPPAELRSSIGGNGSSSDNPGSSSNNPGSSSNNPGSSSNNPGSSAGSKAHGHALPLPAGCGLRVELHDMPVEVWQYGSRAKRQPAASGLIGILQRYAGQSAAAAGAPAEFGTAATAENGVSVTVVGGKEAKPKKRSSSGKKKKGKGKAGSSGDTADEEAAAAVAAAAEQTAGEASAAQGAADAAAGQLACGAAGEAEADPPIVRAVMEYNMPAQLSGKFAWYGIGFASGLLNGLLVGAGIPYQRVHASTWKAGMGLRRQGKEGSIALACHLLPAAAPLLARKKDHGRAEALVLAAYALGVRMQPLGGDSQADGGAAQDEDAEEEAPRAGSEGEEEEQDE